MSGTLTGVDNAPESESSVRLSSRSQVHLMVESESFSLAIFYLSTGAYGASLRRSLTFSSKFG